MQGQWVGKYNSQNPGYMIVNIDARPDCFQVVAYVHPSNPSTPSTVVRLRTKGRELPQIVRTRDFQPIHPKTQAIVHWDAIKDHFPSDTMMSEWVEVYFECLDDKLYLRWGTSLGMIGQCDLGRSEAGKRSATRATAVTWPDFKTYIGEHFRGRNLIFRGQSQPWRLRTSFHRHGRAVLERYISEDLPQLHKHLTARTRHVFDLTDILQLGAFLGLAQHHGYPTPLLDWTASPYVAAFFAYRGVDRPTTASTPPVRIFAFDLEAWTSPPLPQFLPFVLPTLQVSFVDFLAIENERMIPQQGISMQSNVDDIEGHIAQLEYEHKIPLLEALDLPASGRDEVMRELRYMGITAASMFPGLDGMCEELREQNFPK